MKCHRSVRSLRLSAVALAALLGVLAGSGAFTFHYGEGLSYFSGDPQSCVNCHIMQPQYDSWLKSSHHAVATCADCHLPAAFPANLISKSDNGFFHSWAFTFQDFHEPIVMKPRNRRILEQNCRHCHEPIVDEMLTHHRALRGDDHISCLHCHADVGHTGRPRSIGR